MDTDALGMLGWLIVALGIGIIVIALRVRAKRVRSPTRRAADVLSGLVFCLLGSIAIVGPAASGRRKGLLIAACVAAGASWYMGLHARKLDRAGRDAGKHDHR